MHLAAGAAALPTASRIARAQSYPTRPVRIIVGYAAGGVTDIVARLVGQWLSERLGQQFIIENRAGAASNIAAEVVVRAPADGYTLLAAGSFNAINDTLYERLNFNFNRDLAPIASIATSPLVMVVNPSFPARTVPEFIAYAKGNPARLSMASSGAGSVPHIAGELFKMMTAIDMVHVPYRGDGPAIADLIGEQVHVYFGTMAGSIEYVRGRKVRALAVTGATRAEVLPDIPALSDFLPGFEASLWIGLCAPRSTPVAIIETISRESALAIADARLSSRLAEFGLTVLPGTPSQFRARIAEDTEKWAKVIRAANIKAD
jgi:tripartite-type tricarboxylate transporter receptor subunit TctC